MEKVTNGVYKPSKKEKINNALSDRLTDLINDKKEKKDRKDGASDGKES